MVSIVLQWADFVASIAVPPGSTLFIFFLALIITTGSTILTRLVTDPTETARKQAIIKEHQDQKKELEKMKTENPKRWEKEAIRWKRREKSVQKMQQNMSLSRLKPQCITFLPMIVVWQLLGQFYNPGGITNPVAAPAMNPWLIPLLGTYVTSNAPLGWGWINFFSWYFLCSFACGSFIQRIFGVAQQNSFSQLMNQGQDGAGFSTKDMFRKR